MKITKSAIALIIALITLICLAPIALANTATTTMTWYVPSSRSHAVTYPGGCSQSAFYFPEDKAVLDSDTDGNANKILPYTLDTGGSVCQAAGTAAMLLTNNGNVTTNIDANFSAAFDKNTWLKVWQGTGEGCGTGGFGGWKLICFRSILDVNMDLNETNCKDFNSDNATSIQRLVTTLGIGDTNQLCFSGEMMGGQYWAFPADMAAGSEANTFQSSTDTNTTGT